MRAKVIHSYVDNKIRQAIAEKKSANEVIGVLQERVNRTVDLSEKSEKIEKYKSYLVQFSIKRIGDIKFISSKTEFNNIPNNKLLNLVQLKDKLDGFNLDLEL